MSSRAGSVDVQQRPATVRRSSMTRLTVAAALAGLIAACTTLESPTLTPLGQAPSDLLEPLEIVGVSEPVSESVSGASPASAPPSRTVAVPAGTEIVVPVFRGWRLQAGPEGGSPTDHNLGMAWATVSVTAIQPPDLTRTPPTQTASVASGTLLSGPAGTEAWSGRIDYQLLCLRRVDRPTVPAPGPARLHLLMVRPEFVRSGRLPDAREPFRATFATQAPTAATQVIPSLRGWLLGFGAYDGPAAPALSLPDAPAERPLSTFEVAATVAGSDLTVTHVLRDRRGADSWFTATDLDLLALAPAPPAGVPGGPHYDVVGLARRTTIAHNEPGARSLFQELVEVEVPPETTDVLPLVHAWALGYGQYFAWDVPDEPGAWMRQNHRHAVGQAGIYLREIDRSRARPKARVVVSLWLRDRDAADPWFGRVNYTLLFLAYRRG
jgi:hypothetical protein